GVGRLAIGVGQAAAVAHEASEHRIFSPRIAPHHRVIARGGLSATVGSSGLGRPNSCRTSGSGPRDSQNRKPTRQSLGNVTGWLEHVASLDIETMAAASGLCGDVSAGRMAHPCYG